MKSSYPASMEEFYENWTPWLKSLLFRFRVPFCDQEDVLSSVYLRMVETNYLASYGKKSLHSQELIENDSDVAGFRYYIWLLVRSVVSTYYSKRNFEFKYLDSLDEMPVYKQPASKFSEEEALRLQYYASLYREFRKFVCSYDETQKIYRIRSRRVKRVYKEDGTILDMSLTRVLDYMLEGLSLTQIAEIMQVTVASISNWKNKLSALASKFSLDKKISFL